MSVAVVRWAAVLVALVSLLAPRAASATPPLVVKDTVVKRGPAVRPRDYGHSLFVVAPEVGIGSRHFDYTQKVSPDLRSYRLSAAPIVGIKAEVYPFAYTSSAVASAVGIVGEYARSAGLDSSLSDGSKVGTDWSNADIALRVRIPIRARAVVGARVGYGRLAFTYGDAGTVSPELPGVGYDYVRAGADARIAVWRFALYANFDYLAVQKAGAVADRFPRPSVGGIDAGVGAGFTISEHFEARTGVRYQRFFYDFQSKPTDRVIAGGALDELGRWDTSLAFIY